MEIIEFIQRFFVFLLPGILGTLLYNGLNIHKEKHYYIEFLNVLVYSFISFILIDLIFSGIKYLFPCFIYSPIHVVNYISSFNSILPTENVIASIFAALIIACFITKASSNNWLFRLANWFNLTRRIDNKPVWEHIFDDRAVVVLRDMVTSNTYYGKVCSFSDNSTNREIYFEDVYVFNKYSDFLYHAESLYLSRNHNEFTIEIQNDTANNTEVTNNGKG